VFGRLFPICTSMQLLRDLIRESLRSERDAAEREYFGRSRQSMDNLARTLLQAFSVYGDEPDSDVMQDIRRKWGENIQFIGAGAFRVVFSIGNDLILKISLGDFGDGGLEISGHQMNRDDFTLGTDREINHVFPRAYMHGPRFRWVVLERVKPLETESQIIPFFPSSLLPDPNSLDSAGKDVYARMITGALNFKSHHFGDGKPLGSFPGFRPSWGSSDATLGELRADLMVSSPAFEGLANALNRYNIDPNEIRPDNLGIGDDGRLVLLDSSIFPGR